MTAAAPVETQWASADLRRNALVEARKTVIDLRLQFGDSYRIGWEADGATRVDWPKQERVWLLQVRCRDGVVSPYGGSLLQGVTTHPRIGAQLRRLPCVLKARGDGETVVIVHVDDVEAILGILKPYRRRRLSPSGAPGTSILSPVPALIGPGKYQPRVSSRSQNRRQLGWQGKTP